MGTRSRRPDAAGMTTTSTDRCTANKQLVQDFIQDLFTRGDSSAVDRYLAPDFVSHDPPFAGVPEGPEGFRVAHRIIREAVPDWHSDLERMVAEDDVVVEVFTASGTHRGEFMGVPGTGRTLVMRGINVWRVRDGRITERWGRLDDLGVARQLGLVPG
jgi:steroid delta-isomerase-like uncharacterized protein